jgi:hypothetical protein
VLLEQETIDRPQFLRLLDGATQDEVFPPPSAAAPAEPVAEPKAKEKRSILPGLPSLPSEPDAQPGGA